MVTKKIRAIWRVIRAKQLFLYSQAKLGGDISVAGFGVGDLSDMMLVAIELKRSYNSMTEMIEHAATEAGELHLLNELKKVTEAAEKNARD